MPAEAPARSELYKFAGLVFAELMPALNRLPVRKARKNAVSRISKAVRPPEAESDELSR